MQLVPDVHALTFVFSCKDRWRVQQDIVRLVIACFMLGTEEFCLPFDPEFQQILPELSFARWLTLDC